MSKKERDICEFEWNLRKLFCCCSNLSNDDGPNYLHARFENGYGFYRPGLKTGVENDIIWSEIESGFGEPGGTPSPRILRSTPSPTGYKSGANADSTNFTKLALKVDLRLI